MGGLAIEGEDIAIGKICIFMMQPMSLGGVDAKTFANLLNDARGSVAGRELMPPDDMEFSQP